MASFTYDALGRRVEKYDAVAEETSRFYYDGWRVLTETNENGTHLRDYVYGNYLDEVLMMIDLVIAQVRNRAGKRYGQNLIRFLTAIEQGLAR